MWIKKHFPGEFRNLWFCVFLCKRFLTFSSSTVQLTNLKGFLSFRYLLFSPLSSPAPPPFFVFRNGANDDLHLKNLDLQKTLQKQIFPVRSLHECDFVRLCCNNTWPLKSERPLKMKVHFSLMLYVRHLIYPSKWIQGTGFRAWF